MFGKVVKGMEVVKKMEQVGTADGKPDGLVKIVDCGEILEKKIQEATGKERGNLLVARKFTTSLVFAKEHCNCTDFLCCHFILAKKKRSGKASSDYSSDEKAKGRRKRSLKDRRKKRRRYSSSDSYSSDSDSDSYHSDSDSESDSLSSDSSSSSDTRRKDKSRKRGRHQLKKKRKEADRDRKKGRRVKHSKRRSKRYSFLGYNFSSFLLLIPAMWL